MSEPNEFQELLRTLVRRYGSRDALGKAIGMSGSRVGRAIDGQYSFNVVNCLKLAEVTGESPSLVLRAANKIQEASLIERLYGHGRPSVTSANRSLLEKWERLSPTAREHLSTIIEEMLYAANARAARARKKTA